MGIATAIAVATPLVAVENTARQDRSDQSRSSMQERGTDQSATGAIQLRNQTRSSSDIIGMDIQSATGEKIGQVNDFFFDMESGKIVAVVTSTGGLLGTGGQSNLLSPEDVRFDGEKKHLRTDLTKEQLQSAPRYREGDTSQFDNVRPLGESAKARHLSANRGAATGQSVDRTGDREETSATRHSATNREADDTRGDSEVTAYLHDTDRNRADSSGTARAEDRNRADARLFSGGASSADGRTRADSDGSVRATDHTRADSAVYHRDEDAKQGYSAARSLAASDLVGMNIENSAGDNIGSIDKLYLDLEGGQVIGVVVSTGGFLGMGAHQNVLALNELKHNAVEKTLRVDMNREQLRTAPTYKKDDSSWHAALRQRSDRNAERIGAVRTSTETTPRAAQPDSGKATVFNQGNSSAETKMTADIRSAIRENNNMSIRANNVTIITQDKKVLLRGDVDSASEKTAIEGIARGKAGDLNVTSELVVRTR